MSAPTRTPGPWVIMPNGRDVAYFTEDGRYWPVALVQGLWPGGSYRECKVVGRLNTFAISAVPDLIEALEETKLALEFGSPVGNGSPVNIVEKVDRALEKAYGAPRS